ncbi:uncharacterized protein EV154DRAFT_273991 [Mucor mucedo]|uniref:uncharacterized protein n=1 Tax=Mucor mucedo TaxID=29922 RepID=UPI00221E7EB2|nr:uncharacterized protein EV154DRAFT_273991 [Mucor mucedo]KAI7889562.1 hypothetical protein EV154DRAFT_273991 [Mucor mucedo]
MPNIGRREISRADAGCFGMSLAGLDDWERISHAAITLHEDGQIYLATHNASIQPKSVSIHTIKIKFPVKSEKGAIECKPITSLKIQGQDLLKENNVTQMVFKKGLHTVELVLGLGDEVSDGFNGFVTSWQLKKIQQSIPSDFGTITNDRTALVYQSGTMILGRFISCLTSTSTGQIIVGLSDGSIHAELALQEGLVKSSNMEDTAESIDPTYWTVVGAHKTDDGCIDPIADIVLSPNETHLLYIFSSSKIGIARITNDDMHDSYVKELIEKLQLCLLNNVDFMDLISELVRMSKQDKDQPEDIINQVLTTYEIQCGESPLEPLENWSLANLEKGYGLAMAAYRRLPDKKIASVNLSRAIQLPVILECFMASCTTDYEEIIKVLEKENIDTNVKLEFDPDSLWSLISVSTWIRDYLKWILREWNMLFNCISPADSSIANITEKPAHAVLLLHKDSRISLSKILKMLHYFVQYTSTASFQLETFSETQGLLQRYTSTLMTDDMIMMKDTIDFLNALNDLEQKPTGKVDTTSFNRNCSS